MRFIKGNPAFALGIDAQWVGAEDEHASSFLAGESKANSDIGVYQGVAKLAYPRGWIRPYLMGGNGISGSEFDQDVTDDPDKHEKVADSGPAIGVQYMYYLPTQRTIGIGVDMLRSALTPHESTTLFTDYKTSTQFQPVMVMAIGKLAFGTGRVHPYLFGGIGMDIFITPSLFIGAEARGTYLGDATFERTAGPSVIGLSEDARGDLITFNLLARLGIRFGA